MRMCVCVYVYVHVGVYVYMCVCVCTCVYVLVCVLVCMCICVLVCNYHLYTSRCTHRPAHTCAFPLPPTRNSVCIFVFDLLFFNGRSLLHLPLAERRHQLESHFSPVRNRVMLSEKFDVQVEGRVGAWVCGHVGVWTPAELGALWQSYLESELNE